MSVELMKRATAMGKRPNTKSKRSAGAMKKYGIEWVL
jgi:hypothetical protein